MWEGKAMTIENLWGLSGLNAPLTRSKHGTPDPEGPDKSPREVFLVHCLAWMWLIGAPLMVAICMTMVQSK